MHFAGAAPDLGARVDQAIVQALVVVFRVIVLQELANRLTQRRFAEDDQAVDTLFLEAGGPERQPACICTSLRDRARTRTSRMW
jgi:hypothetical protein